MNPSNKRNKIKESKNISSSVCKEKQKRKNDKQLDEELKNTFPASDSTAKY